MTDVRTPLTGEHTQDVIDELRGAPSGDGR